MLDYAGLEALAAVVREGSFERAARKLHVTPSAVSQRIKLLEERVGQVLVLRGQPCSGTDAGRRLCLHLEQVALLENDRSEEHTSELQSPCNLVCRLLLEKKKKSSCCASSRSARR